MIGEGQVKYYRGQVTMTVISPGQETIPEEETEAIEATVVEKPQKEKKKSVIKASNNDCDSPIEIILNLELALGLSLMR